MGESTLQIRPATVTKKKKAKNGKAKEHKGKNGNVGKIEKGFENPVYEVEDDQVKQSDVLFLTISLLMKASIGELYISRCNLTLATSYLDFLLFQPKHTLP